jgi:ribosomal protein S18 acetylase RimI-like enzyme
MRDRMAQLRRYDNRDFVDYVATLEKTTPWKKRAGTELKARLEKLTRRDQVWIAEVNGRAVGFMILSPKKDGSLEVDWFDVHPDFQRMGIGTLLVEKAAKVARAKNIMWLSIHTHVTNKGVIGFADKNGFYLFEKIKDFYGKRKDALRFRKVIPYKPDA